MVLKLVKRRKLKNGKNGHVGLDVEMDGEKVGKARLSVKRKSPTTLEIGFSLDLDEKEKPPDDD